MVTLWNATAGRVIRQLKLDEPMEWARSQAVAVSNNADWTLLVGTVVGATWSAQLRLWNSAGRLYFSDEFNVDHDRYDDWSASLAVEGHRCAVLIENHEKGTREVHEWTISAAAGLEKTIESVGTAPIAVTFPCIYPVGTRELLL